MSVSVSVSASSSVMSECFCVKHRVSDATVVQVGVVVCSQFYRVAVAVAVAEQRVRVRVTRASEHLSDYPGICYLRSDI